MSLRTLLVSRTFRLLVGAGILAILLWRVGFGPFIDGLRLVDAQTLLIALLIGAVTTVCCAWRWRTVSRALGLELSLGEATAAYYRSIFLNTTLPGGVVGDVHRAVRHGQDAGDVNRGVRSVAWERTAGQVVQIIITVAILMVVPSPVQSWMPVAALVLLLLGVGFLLVGRLGTDSPRTRLSRIRHTAVTDVRVALLHRSAWPVVVGASVVVVAGHATVFVVAARTAGADASALSLLPLALIVLAAMAIPLSVAGWGPREGVAAWTFAAAGLGAAAGVTTAVIYGVMALVASLPGAAVVLIAAARQKSIAREEAVHG